MFVRPAGRGADAPGTAYGVGLPTHCLMRKPISPRAHGAFDYVVVAVFALAPSALGLVELAAALSYGLAAVHLLLTLATAFPLGVAGLVPFRTHGAVEAAVGVALLVGGLVLFRNVALVFFLAVGAAVLAVWALTDYAGADRP